MILNQHQYHITRKKIQEFELALLDIRDLEIPQDLNEKLLNQCQIDALESQLQEMKEEIEEYEALK